jgi:type IV secretion system protein TrbL
MSCGWVASIVPGGCQLSQVPGLTANALVNSISADLANVMKSLMTFWIKAPNPDLSSGPGSVIAQVQNITTPIIVFSVIVGIIVAGMKLIRASSDTQGDLESLTRGLLLIVAVSVAGATVVALLESGFAEMAQYILDKGFNGHDVGQTLLTLFSDPTGGGSISTIIFGILGIIVSAIQWAIMIFRGAILALLVGILPVAAAGALTNGGMQSFKKVCGWIAAFILYRAAAAIIYATAFLMLGSGSSSGIMFGEILIVLSILALPALLRRWRRSDGRSGRGSGDRGGAAG